ncbi:MAG: calcium-binding protein [Acidimicrobiia bacterium]
MTMQSRFLIALSAGLLSMAVFVPAATAALGSAQITGTVGEIVDLDPAAGPGFPGQEGYFLRYVGVPAPSGYSHDYQWADPYIETVSPEDAPVIFQGTLDLGTRVAGQTSFIGLTDKASHAAGFGGGGDAASTWTDGASIYVSNHATDGSVKIGVSDGNAGGGEYVQVFHTLNLAYINAAGGVIDVTFVIDGTVDPTSCGGLVTDAGCLTLIIDDLAPLTDSYGAKLAPGSAVPEFSEGGHPGWDASHSGGGGIGYDLNVSPILTADPEPIPPRCTGLPVTIVGTEGDDVIHGTDGDDVIVGLGGNDTIYGLGGDDVICGDGGDDVLHGGSGHDLLVGGDGDDIISGDGGKDTILGGSGNDTLTGKKGADDLRGGDGNDELYGKKGRDRLKGNSGDDQLFGGKGRDYLNGGDGNDVLDGGKGRDRGLNGPTFISIEVLV